MYINRRKHIRLDNPRLDDWRSLILAIAATVAFSAIGAVGLSLLAYPGVA
jgi:hypothetical protein